MKKVLIVDDNPHFIGALKFIIESSCKDKVAYVIEASSGVECLDILNSNTIDIIFMDIDMPELNGIETTKIIVDRYRNIKIIAVTFHTEEDYLIEIIEAGARGFIPKSKITKQQIVEILGCAY